MGDVGLFGELDLEDLRELVVTLVGVTGVVGRDADGSSDFGPPLADRVGDDMAGAMVSFCCLLSVEDLPRNREPQAIRIDSSKWIGEKKGREGALKVKCRVEETGNG